ncbi:MAG: hypothetical protein ABFQ65_02245 [Nanoarchaeota archaeon]
MKLEIYALGKEIPEEFLDKANLLKNKDIDVKCFSAPRFLDYSVPSPLVRYVGEVISRKYGNDGLELMEDIIARRI